MKNYDKLDVDFVRRCLDYVPETGVFVWKVELSPRGKVGQIAGCAISNKYLRVGIDNVYVLSHHLAWFYVNGVWPPAGYDIDHIDGDRQNNSISNLRLATKRQNRFNTAFKLGKSGVPGVTIVSRKKPYVVRMRLNGSKITVGSFASLSEAKAAYQEAAKKRNGSFYRTEFLG